VRRPDIRNLNSSGFTLLEVMLALSLVSLVLYAMTVAIDVHLRLLDSGRTQVEEAQLARALLGRIADDLRSAVAYRPVETEEFLMGLTADLGDAVGDMAAMGEAAGLDSQSVEGMDDSLDEFSSDLSDPSELPPIPGLYGNDYQLQVDTSRLPRIDQYDGMLSTTGEISATDLVSDVKTVTYYVLDDLQSTVAYTSSVSQAAGGLVRRERDRAAAAYASQSGELAESESQQELIAPEVAAIEFRYFDGTEWVEEWDSDDRGGLPVAVDIAIGITPVRRRDNQAASWQTINVSTTTEDDELLIYRLLVHLPAAEPTTEGQGEASDMWDESETSEDSEASGDSGPSLGSGTDFGGGTSSGGGTSGGAGGSER